ncbi:LytTR family DNA-binding domain-containing protein [Sphingobacterium multivorum]|uniref:LytTR family DNA-binding domain-containing protein n=1 Tax=Sphingobacterium multivorum TaxID=28454 RepID=UPI0028B1EEDA|nr:LytTR family DNA-binding domain-containing protein [Sphingobacterium multivorum]
MKKNVISTITKSLPIEFSSLVNYSLLVTLCYINLFLEKEEYQFRGTLNDLQSELPSDRFARPRNNTLVNLAMVDLVRPDELYLVKPRNGFRIVMTRYFKDNFRHQYEAYKQNNR